jgi:tetratricopeptide (TPR) repeat protein
LLALLVLLAAVAHARADEPPDGDAKRHYQAGTKHFNLGEYDEAVKEYKEAYRLSEKPYLLYNIAQSYRLSGNEKEALKFYNSFLNAFPDAPNRDAVLALISDLEKSIAAHHDTATKPPTGPEPQPDHKPIPRPDKVSLPPPGHDLPATSDHPHKPIYKKAWFWAGIGAVVVGATVATLVATHDSGPHAPSTGLGNFQVF